MSAIIEAGQSVIGPQKGALGKDQGSLPKGSDVYLMSRWGWAGVFQEAGRRMCGSEPRDCGLFEGLKEIQSWLECTVDGGKVEVLRNDAVAASRYRACREVMCSV